MGIDEVKMATFPAEWGYLADRRREIKNFQFYKKIVDKGTIMF
jgi:hypothetical protein